MCGILGQINFNNVSVPFDETEFKFALNLMNHRGPDDFGIYKEKNFIFGQRRLSIIDLDSRSSQPMISYCKNYILVLNGEIYNYVEIKKDLQKLGYKFYTSSDTEVVLCAFEEYGINCIDYFIGMFAFSIYDRKNNEYYIVRDRLGIKPLYYTVDKNRVIFSSEIKSILKLANNKPKLNINAISSYMSYRYPILNDTFFEDIFTLPPAHYIKVSKSSLDFKEYWNVSEKFNEQKNDKGEEYYIAKLRDLIESSVRYRMRSDVPFGAFLSGGVDSSIITALMAKNATEPIKTFTIGFEEEGYNEFQYAQMVADKYNTNHKEITISSKDYENVMNILIGFKDAPLSVPNEVPLYLMSRELKKYITVVLSGEGADEIFGGYGRIFKSPYDLERIQNIDNLNYTKEEKEELIKNFVKKYLVDGFSSEIEHFFNIYNYTSLENKKELLSTNIDLNYIENLFIKKFMSYFDDLENESYYNKLMYAFEKVHIVGLLHRVDTTTMATSVEARVPFVDHRLVEFAFTIPIKYKLKWNSEQDKEKSKTLMSDMISEVYDTPKYILKKAYEDMIPYEVLYRKKMGFPVPLHNWFGGDFKKYAKEVMLSDEAKSRNLYNIKNIENCLESDRLRQDHSFAMRIWMLINIELFMKKYFD